MYLNNFFLKVPNWNIQLRKYFFQSFPKARRSEEEEPQRTGEETKENQEAHTNEGEVETLKELNRKGSQGDKKVVEGREGK